MEETPHLITHFMAVGAEKRLEDYHFLRNTYETITAQEIQLNRILRILGEDEFSLNWRVDLLPIGRARSRSVYEFDRWNNTYNLQGSLAYERLRDLQEDNSKNRMPPTIPSSSRRVQEIRERRQRLSEQRDYPSGSASGGSSAPSSSRLRALADYDTAVAESEAKRRRQAEENRLNASKNEEKEVPERRREKFRTTFDDEYEKSKNNSDIKSKQQEDKPGDRLTKNIHFNGDQDENATKDQKKDSEKTRKSSVEYDHDKTGDIELISFTVRCQAISSSNKNEDENNPSVRLQCQWASPSSSSAINYFTIERQSGDNEWSPIGEKIDKLENQTQLDISTSTDEKINPNIPSSFRLKAHLQNGQTFTSKPTDGIFINLSQEKQIIIPDVEILSPSSVQLTWNDKKNEDNENKKNENEDNRNEGNENEDNRNEGNENENNKNEDNENENENNENNENEDNENENNKNKEKTNTYDVEKKEEQQLEWEKVTEVPLSQRSVRIDSLTDASQCQFRLIPSASEPEETAKPENEAKLKESTKAEKIGEPEKSIKPEKEVEPEETEQEENEVEPEETTKPETKIERKESIKSEKIVEPEKSTKGEKIVEPEKPIKQENEAEPEESAEAENEAEPEESAEAENEDEPEESAEAENEAEPQESAEAENEAEPEESAEAENEVESEVLTVDNVNEWLSSLHIVPTSPNTVDVDISEEGFKEFDCYKIEYTTANQLDKWKQVSNITHDDPHLTIDNLKQGTDYKFRFTPISSDTSTNDTNSSQLSLVLDVQMPTKRKGRFTKDEEETPVSTPPQFLIQKLDPTTVLIEAVVPEEQPATFEDVYDVYSKNETTDDDWTKVGTIDKEHLSTTIEDLEENTTYAFKIDNTTSPSADDESNTIQEFKYNTTPAKKYDPSLFLEKIEQSLENVVNGVMQAAAGHQTLDEPVNKSLNEVIKEVFRDETLVPNEQYGFETLELNNDLQLYRGPKQMMLKDLEISETIDLSKHYGEIIIHNYRTSQQSVIVREENGNTRVANIDGDIIIRNVVSDVLLKNEQTHHQLSMNIVGQAFLKGVQGTLIASKFKGIIVVKNVHKP